MASYPEVARYVDKNGFLYQPLSMIKALAIYLDGDENVDKYTPASDGHLGSLLYESYWEKNLVRSLFTHFTLLRVLKFEGMMQSLDRVKLGI
ncbi:disease resistance protein [Pyrus ussuriensis x Pyrus communis]|uniref:Disease resistance protein n=1 Tax=Pyrus ussuriensis x Pyrus communis TaxID=2448454 RepID=A0A5N5GGG2_9ROSA|nr:disease resistance protein [Pyrus ussuriensis x Pyrus communis]